MIEEKRKQALDCIEWLRVFRMRYDRAGETGSLEAMDAVEDLFYAMWNGHGGECSQRWCDLIGAPVEDGGFVLHQEAPYECLHTWYREKEIRRTSKP